MEMRYGAKKHLVSLVIGLFGKKLPLLVPLFCFLTPLGYAALPADLPGGKQVVEIRTVSNLLQTCGEGNNIERTFWAHCLVDGHCSGSNKFWAVAEGTGRLTEYSDGTADLEMTIFNVDDDGLVFEITGTFTGRTSDEPSGSPKEGLCVGDVDNSDWYYYTGFTAEMVGKEALKGGHLTLERTGPAFQIGTGAGLTNMAYGGATWLKYTVDQQPHDPDFHLKKKSGMDFNFGLETTCPIEIEDVVLYQLYNGARIGVLENGASYHRDQLPGNFGIKALINGNAGSVCYEVNGHELNDNTSPYTYPGPGQAWDPLPGEYEIVVKAFTIIDKDGILCDERRLNIEILDCDNVTNGGRIGYDQTICSNLYDPAELVSIRDPSGGSGAMEFLWLKSTVTCDLPTSLNDPKWTVIEGANGPSYDPKPITESTCFLRCSRRAGCDRYLGESNIIRIEMEAGPEATVVPTDPTCGKLNGEIAFYFRDMPGRSNVEFSKDGGKTYPLNVRDRKGRASFRRLEAGTYRLFMRWGNDECPVDLGTVELVNQSIPLTTAGQLSGKEKYCGGYDPGLIEGTEASGGFGGKVVYQWEKRSSSGNWEIIDGATGRNFDPGFLDETTRFRRAASRDNNCGRWKYSNVITKIVDDPPAADFQKVNPTCGEHNGQIKFFFRDHARRSHISFSKDGGKSFRKTTKDNTGSVSFDHLPPGDYHLMVRWGNRDCPVDLGNVQLENEGAALSDGGHIGDNERHCGPYIGGMIEGDVPAGSGGRTIQYQWQRKTTGNWEDISGATLKDFPGEFIAVSTWYRRGAKLDNECHAWRFSNTVDRHVLVLPDAKVFTVDPTCGKKNGEIIFTFSDVEGRTNIEFSKDGGATYPLNVKDHKGIAKFRNLSAGLYHLYVRWGNNDCPVEIGSIQLIETSAPLTNAGRISGNERFCGPYDATVITGTEASGGFGGEVRYQWQRKTTGMWEDIAGANSINYDPGMIYESTWFRRRAKRANECDQWRTSNSVDRHVTPPPTALVSTTQPNCGEQNGSITFSFVDFAGRTHLEFSKDGGDSWQLRSEDKAGTASFNDLPPDNYHLYIRWGNDDCPVDLGTVTLETADDLDRDGTCDEEDCRPADPFYPAQPGTPCDDGDDNTVDDVVRDDFCTCSGVVPPCEVEACLLELDQDPVLYLCEQGEEVSVSVSVTDPGLVPPGYEVLYLLAVGDQNRIAALNKEDAFTFKNPGEPLRYEIFCFVYDPTAFDAGRIQLQQTTAGDLRNIILTEDLCADINEEGPAFEFEECAGLGNLVWDDTDQDGVQDDNESGLAGVTVYAMGEYGKAIYETTTDASGQYGFAALRPGEYLLQFVAPEGYAGSPRDMGDDDAVDSDAGFNTGMTGYVTLAPGEYNSSIDAGFYQEGTCNAYCELELETPAEIFLCEMTGPSANITATSVGNDVIPAGYRVKYILTDGEQLLIEKLADEPSFRVPKPEPGICRMHCLVYNPDPQSEDYFDVGTLARGVSLYTIEEQITVSEICAYLDLTGAKFEFIDCPVIGDRVFQDLNVNGIQDEGEPGLAGVRVNLRQVSDGALVRTDVTSGSGRYGFYVMAGDYYLEFETPDGYNITPMHWGGDPKIDSDIDPATGLTVPLSFPDALASTIDLDAGYFDASICFAHCQLTLDQDPDIYLCQMTTPSVTISASSVGTPFIPAGYQVLYVLTEGDGLLIEKANTEASFNVPKPEPGVCRVHCVIYDPEEFNNEDLVNNIRFKRSTLFELADDILAKDDCAYIDYVGVAFEFIDCPLIGNQVFADLNSNGIQDNDEGGISGVKVELLDATDRSIVASVATNSRGQYYFYTMGGDYYLQFTTPAGYEVTLPGQGTDFTKDSDVDPVTGLSPLISLPQGSYVNTDIDAGFVPVLNLQAISPGEQGRRTDQLGGRTGRRMTDRTGMVSNGPFAEAVTDLTTYPNPFLDDANIVFELAEAGLVIITLRDSQGRLIRKLNGEFSTGRHQLTINGDELPVGLIHCTLMMGEERITKTMLRMEGH